MSKTPKTSKTPKPSAPDPRAKREALAYIEPTIRYCLTDCIDGMHESRDYLQRFGAVTDDALQIGPFIAQHLRAEWRAEVARQVAESGDDLSDGWPVCTPPQPLDTLLP